MNSRHRQSSAGRSSISNDCTAIKPRNRHLDTDSGCQRQRLSIIRRGVATTNLMEIKDLPCGPCRLAMLTACRKVWRMYRPYPPASRPKAPEKSGVSDGFEK